MAWNPKLVLYACVAKGIAVLAEYKSPGSFEAAGEISEIARKCIEKSPRHHSNFNHTGRGWSYVFLIDESFTYFTIARENLGVRVAQRFLERVRDAFVSTCRDAVGSEPKELCCQAKLSPIFSGMLAIEQKNGLTPQRKEEKSRVLVTPPGVILLTKKKRVFEGHVGDNRIVLLRKELPVVATHKVEGANEQDEKQKMKKMWKMHVWVVLALDLIVCAVLFGIWLGVCEGFKCIDG